MKLNDLVIITALSMIVAQAAMADLLDEDPVSPAPAPIVSPAAPASPLPKPPVEKGVKKPAPAPAAPSATPHPASAKPPTQPGVLAPKGGGGEKSGAKKDGKQPVQFESKGLRGLREKGTVELIENVVVTQGTMRLEADHAKVFFDEAAKDVQRVVAEGNVKVFKVDEDSGEKIKAYSNTAVFDNKARTVVLDGNARFWRGADLLRGKKIIYEMDSGWIRADRVVGEVHPGGKDKDPKDPEDDKPPSTPSTSPQPTPAPGGSPP